jgi:catechol 2,3-dioxygenase-like lactoylglutathione lyase family enzyme
MRADPRLLETWSSQVKMWEIGHPLGIKGLAYVTLGVKDLDAAAQTYVERIGAIGVASGVDDGGQFRYQLVQLGDCLLQIAQPLDDQSPLGQHVARWGNMIYGITFSVRDLDSAEAWLDKKSIRTSRPRDGLLAADPEDCFGAAYFFTTDALPEVP